MGTRLVLEYTDMHASMQSDHVLILLLASILHICRPGLCPAPLKAASTILPTSLAVKDGVKNFLHVMSYKYHITMQQHAYGASAW